MSASLFKPTQGHSQNVEQSTSYFNLASLLVIMNYQYSNVIEPHTYDAQGLCANIPLRKHIFSSKENLGTSRAQQDWSRLVSQLDNYKGGLGADYSFVSVTVPECLPARLEILSYANEFAFLYDGAVTPFTKCLAVH